MPKEKIKTRELAEKIAGLGWEKKAENLVVLEVSQIVSYTDYLIIMSGQSDRQVLAIADNIEDRLHDEGIKPVGVEGKAGRQWVLMDYGSVIVHIFYEGIRSFYDLERLWHDAPRLDITETDDGLILSQEAKVPVPRLRAAGAAM